MTPAVKLLEQTGIPFQLHVYDHAPECTDYGMEAAQKLGVDPACMLKTLVVRSDTGSLGLALVSVRDRLDLKKLAQALGSKKADLAETAIAEKTTGYVIGGISPLGGRKKLPVLIDHNIHHYDHVFVSAGKRGLELELQQADLIQLTHATVVSLAVSGPG